MPSQETGVSVPTATRKFDPRKPRTSPRWRCPISADSGTDHQSEPIHDRVQAYVAQTLAEAHLIRGYLAGEGIECEIRNEHLIGGMGELPVTADTLPQVWVGEAERQRARELIYRALDRRPAPSSDWICPDCLETIEAQFTDCWSCGASRPQ